MPSTLVINERNELKIPKKIWLIREKYTIEPAIAQTQMYTRISPFPGAIAR